MEKKPIYKDILAVGGILAVLIIFFYKFVFLGMIPINSEWFNSTYYPWKAFSNFTSPLYFNNDTDPVLYMYPIKYITIQIMKSGHLPLWNPYILCGAPLWGNNFACPLNPLNIVFFLFDFAKAWGIFLMLQFAVAGVSMYFLSMEMGARRFGAVIAAVAYMLNITFVIWFQTLSYLGVFSWLPLAFLLIEKTIKTRSYIAAFWCGVSFALFVWSGLIQLAAYCLAFSSVYLLFRMLQSIMRDKTAIVKYILLTGVVLIVSMIFSFPELVVQKTNIMNSTRTPGRYGLSLLYPQMLISYLSPYFYGMKYDGWDIGFGTYIFNRGLIRLSPPYLGILPIFLAVIGFITRRKGDRYLFLLSSVGILILLMSFALPVIYKPIMRFMPFFGSVDHCRLTTIYIFSMAIMAGWGASALLIEDGRKKLISMVTLSVLLFMLIVFVGLEAISSVNANAVNSALMSMANNTSALVFDGSHSVKSIYKFLEYLNMLKKSSVMLVFSHEVMIPIMFAFISAALIICILKLKKRAVWQAAALAFLAFDLLYYGLAFPAYSDKKSVFPDTPSSKFLSQDKSLYRVLGYSDKNIYPKGDLYPPNAGIMYGFYDIRGYENIGQARWYYRFIMGDKPDDIVVEKFNDYGSKFLPFLNVKYLMSSKAIKSDKWQLLYDKEIKIYNNKDVKPRAFLTNTVINARDEQDVQRIMKDPSFDPTREVVTQEKLIESYPTEPVSLSYPLMVSYGANEVIMKASGKHGMLVLSDTYYPGWKVFVDGKERYILKVNSAFKGVWLDYGDRVVRFIFHPRFLYETLYFCSFIFLIMIAVTARALIKL